jgi:pyruvate,water dikinase
MISGECSGVIFGSNPSNPSEAVIESVYGLNQGLVDGTVEPDRWILDRKTGTIRSRFSPERNKVLVPSLSGAMLTALPSKLKDMPPLDDKRVKEVFRLAKKAEGLFGMPQDVEWTIREETLYVLQSRAITTLLNGQDDDARPWYLSLRRSYENLIELSQRVEQKLIPSMLEDAETMAEQDLSVLSDTAFHYEIRSRAETARKWVKTYRTDFIPLAHGIRLFGQMYNDIMNPSAPYEFMALLANTEMKSIERNRMLRHMAEQAASKPQLAADLKKGIIPDKEFRTILDDYIRKFGDVYSDITHNIPEKQSIIQTVLGMASQPLAEQKNRAHDNDQLEQGFFSHFTPDKRKFAEELLALARTSYRLRDDDNIYLGKIKGQLFRAIEEMRARNRQDIPAEALEILEEQTGLKKTEDQPGLSIASGVQARQIVGQPSGPGISRGKARVIHDASDLHSLKAGEILICDAIDPSMTFVVPLSAGIVERRGGMLIHGAIIAREYGLPCVTGVPDAIQLIKTGDTVTVDGYLGLVIIDKE